MIRDLQLEVSNLKEGNVSLVKQLAREKILRQRSIDTSAEKYQTMEQDLDAAIEAQDNAEEALKDFLKAGRERIAIREERGRGKPVNDKFVRHARTLLSTGGSARSTLEQLHLNAAFFLSEKEYALFLADVPSIRWFQYHREGLGLESYLYTLMRIAKCERVLQWGFDETSLDGIGTLNQWVRIEEMGEVHVLTLECAGLLTGGTALKVGEHVKVFWQRGQQAMMMLREVMGGEADMYVPLVNGGISLSKLCGVMHDTCNSANAIARRIRVLRDESGSELYGDEEWRRMLGVHEREWLDFLCGNHLRNLHFDAFLRLFEAYIKVPPSAPETDLVCTPNCTNSYYNPAHKTVLRLRVNWVRHWKWCVRNLGAEFALSLGVTRLYELFAN